MNSELKNIVTAFYYLTMVDILDMRKYLAEGWGHSSARRVPAYKYDDMGSTPQDPCNKISGVVVCTYNPSAGRHSIPEIHWP